MKRSKHKGLKYKKCVKSVERKEPATIFFQKDNRKTAKHLTLGQTRVNYEHIHSSLYFV